MHRTLLFLALLLAACGGAEGGDDLAAGGMGGSLSTPAPAAPGGALAGSGGTTGETPPEPSTGGTGGSEEVPVEGSGGSAPVCDCSDLISGTCEDGQCFGCSRDETRDFSCELLSQGLLDEFKVPFAYSCNRPTDIEALGFVDYDAMQMTWCSADSEVLP